MRVELSNDQWVELRDPERVTESGRRSFKIASAVAADTKATAQERAEALAFTDDYLLSMFIEAWSFGEPVPSAQILRVRELPGPDFDKLIGLLTHREVLDDGELLDPDDWSKGWARPPKFTKSIMDRAWLDTRAGDDVLEEAPDMAAPFLAAGTPEVAAGGGGDRPGDAAATGVADVQAPQAGALA